jgi:2-methylisocitrate lyase-like PEP mutase family enzyme
VDLPLMVDADTGFGNALNVRHTVRTLERAGADCIQLEDQVSAQALRPLQRQGGDRHRRDAVGKIKAAVDARRDSGLLIMARTDACARTASRQPSSARSVSWRGRRGHPVRRGGDAGRGSAAMPQRLDKPQLMNMVIGGKTPTFGADELGQLGFGFVLYANAALQGAVVGMQKALGVLRDSRQLTEEGGLVATFEERQRLVGKPEWDALERLYV